MVYPAAVMDEAGDERDEADAIWGSSAADPEIVEPTGGRLRRRSGLRRSAEPMDFGLPPASPSVAPGQAAPGGIDDLWVALTAIRQRVDHLSEATSALRTEVSRSLADVSAAVAGGQGQTVQAVHDAIARSHDQVSREVESSSSELRRHFTDDLESVTGSMADALAQVAGQLERLSAASSESRDTIDALGQEFHAVSSRLDGLELPPPVDLIPVTDAVIRVATLVEELTERIG